MKCACGHAVSTHDGEQGSCSAKNCDCGAFKQATAAQVAAFAEDATDPTAPDAPDSADRADEDTPPDVPGIPFEALLIVEGVETSDDRYIEPGALTWREPPLPLMSQLKSEHGGFADTAAEIGGRIDEITREPFGTWDGDPQPDNPAQEIIARGMLDAAGEIGLETARLITGEFLQGVSADLAVSAADVEITAVDDDGWPIGERFIVTAGELGMATCTPFPAFAECQIRLLEGDPDLAQDPLAVPDLPEVGDRIPVIASITDGGDRGQSFTYTLTDGCVPCEQRGTVVAAGGPLAPPAAWFDDPRLDGPTPHTVTDDGRVFGHLASWGTCHTGNPGACVTAPHEPDYSYFETGALVTDTGETIPVGQLTLAGGHADLHLGYRAAIQHYDDTESAVADVRMGADDHGIWFAGALRPGVTDEQIRSFRAAALSGDWRPIGGRLRLVAACSVNVPGFPLPRARVASGQTVALVAAGVVREPENTTTTGTSLVAALAPETIAELNQFARERRADRALAQIAD